jgi:GT2 family glycosyltransferase
LRLFSQSSGAPRRAAARLIGASRACFDAELRGASILTARDEALRAALAEATALRSQLTAFQNSKSWRLTAPLRRVMERLHEPAPELAPAPVTEPPAYVPQHYAEWIAAQEPGMKRLFNRELPGHGKLWAPRLALIILPGGTHTPAPVPGVAILEPGAVDVFGFATQVDADFIGFHDSRDRLAPEALLMMREALARSPQTVLAFADEDWLDDAGARTSPFFKPGWDPELARGRDLIGPFAFFSARLLRDAKPCDSPAWRLDIAYQIAAIAGGDRILHIPAVLCHRMAPPLEDQDVLAAHLTRTGVAARLEALPAATGLQRVIYDLPVEPLVSILICTRDRADLLHKCMDGLLNHTDYAQFEVILVDNGSVERDALTLLAALGANPRVTVLRQTGPFNWAASNNAAAARAAGEILLLLNNDIEVREPGWLREIAAQAVQPGVGAVGAKLIYPDGRIQHAGLSVDDGGVPKHLFRFAEAGAPGPYGLMCLAREVWAVTGACLAVPREIFEAVGGLNEALPIAANDVEFCLRLGALGYRVIFTPWAVLAHHEQATRLPDDTDEKRERARRELNRMLRDWGVVALHDPYLNPNLMLHEEQLVLRELALPLS